VRLQQVPSPNGIAFEDINIDVRQIETE